MMKNLPPNWGGYKENFSESLYIMGRLKPGVNMEQATSNVNLLFQQILRGFPDAPLSRRNLEELMKIHVPLTPMTTGLSSLRRAFSEPLKILMAVVALVLLIACANIANILLAWSTAGAREFAVRQALGARRMRLIRPLLTESLLLAAVGGVLGIGFASVASRLLASHSFRWTGDGAARPLDQHTTTALYAGYHRDHCLAVWDGPRIPRNEAVTNG
jgi:macrolide transport system ATP-binding/permease protein